MGELFDELIQRILLRGRAGPRLINDTAVQVDVWSAFGNDLRSPVDLILTPYDSLPAATLARELQDRLINKASDNRFRITPLQNAVVINVSLEDFITVLLPLTGLDVKRCVSDIEYLVQARRAQGGDASADYPVTPKEIGDFALAYAGELTPDMRATLLAMLMLILKRLPMPYLHFSEVFLRNRWPEDINYSTKLAFGYEAIFHRVEDAPTSPLVWRIARNRPVHNMGVSVETVKADAAQRVFDVDCHTLTWAVIDSGIDAAHPAFRDHEAGGFSTRIDKAYDFSRLRDLVSYDTLANYDLLEGVLTEIESTLKLSKSEALKLLDDLRRDSEEGRPFDWEKLSRLLETSVDQLPVYLGDKPDPHGTHVAGVLAGDWRENEKSIFKGVCPNLRLYDLRILGASMESTEFAVIAALEFIRWLNGRNKYMTIHGANLSIGLVHDRANFACGRTPVCMACEHTVASGVSVVTAAGNWGAQSFTTKDGYFEGFISSSIADPGNAASVITVGATHRERPHEYGVSYFSSRGPTADGRAKPDVVAPGEKIEGPLPNLGMGRLDGTSMAAPHVSGVAALLMARYPELIGNPARVKDIIVRTATDLNRDRYFQGAGLVDALRALQST